MAKAATTSCRCKSLLSSPRDFAGTRKQINNLKLEVKSLKLANVKLQTKVCSLKKTVNQYKGRLFRSQRGLNKLSTKHSVVLGTLATNKRLNTQRCMKLQAEKRNVASSVVAATEPLTEKVDRLQGEIEIYESKMADLREQLVDMAKPNEVKQIQTKSKSRYTNAVRKCVYLCARRQVPLHSISTVIRQIGKTLFDHDLGPLPCPSSVCSMVSEMGVLASVQAVEAMLLGSYVNIAWDATTLNGVHINEVHVNTASGSFALNVGRLAGGTTEDYVDHLKSTLETACKLYCDNRGADYDEILASLKLKITSTLSDRAVVNTLSITGVI